MGEIININSRRGVVYTSFYDLHKAIMEHKEGYGRINVYHSDRGEVTINISWSEMSVLVYNPITWDSEVILRASSDLDPMYLNNVAHSLA